MESRMTVIVSASLLSVALSLPANAGEKITGHNSDFQLLSEVTAKCLSGNILNHRNHL